MRTLIYITLLFLVSSNAVASKTDKIRVLMEAQGILERFSTVQDRSLAKSKQEAIQLVNKMDAELSPKSEKVSASFKEAYTTFMENYLAPINEDEMVKVYAEFYGEKFTEEELDELIDFYTSDLGKKEVVNSYKATSEFWEHFRKIRQPIVQGALNEFIAKIKAMQKGSSN